MSGLNEVIDNDKFYSWTNKLNGAFDDSQTFFSLLVLGIFYVVYAIVKASFDLHDDSVDDDEKYMQSCFCDFHQRFFFRFWFSFCCVLWLLFHLHSLLAHISTKKFKKIENALKFPLACCAVCLDFHQCCCNHKKEESNTKIIITSNQLKEVKRNLQLLWFQYCKLYVVGYTQIDDKPKPIMEIMDGLKSYEKLLKKDIPNDVEKLHCWKNFFRSIIPYILLVFLVTIMCLAYLSFDLHPLACIAEPEEELITYEMNRVELEFSDSLLVFQKLGGILVFVLSLAFLLSVGCFFCLSKQIVKNLKLHVHERLETEQSGGHTIQDGKNKESQDQTSADQLDQKNCVCFSKSKSCPDIDMWCCYELFPKICSSKNIVRALLLTTKYIAQLMTIPLLLLQIFDTYSLLCFLPDRYCSRTTENKLHLLQVAITLLFYCSLGIAHLTSTMLMWHPWPTHKKDTKHKKARSVDEVLKFSYLQEKVDSMPGRDTQLMSVVPPTDLTKFPYQNVGKLFFKLGSKITYTSAYYVGGQKVLTVAHGLVTTLGNATNLIFIPAMIDNNDFNGKNYGTFPIVGGLNDAYKPDPEWDPNKPKCEHDICIVYVKGKGTNGKTIAETLTNPISLLFNQTYDTLITSGWSWNTIGYPDSDTQGRMNQISGTFVEQVANTVTKTGMIPTGFSGGPWILQSNSEGNGVQAGNQTKGAISPYFHNPWNFEALDALVAEH